MVEWDTKRVPAKRRGSQKRDDQRVEKHGHQFLFPYLHLLHCRGSIAEFLCILGHAGDGKDDLSETERQATVAVHVKSFGECLVIDVPELVCNGREERGDGGIEQLAEPGVLALSKHGEKVVILQGEQSCELKLQEMSLAGLTASESQTLPSEGTAVPGIHVHTMYLMDVM